MAFAREHRPNLVLMDINLKGDMDGISAASIIRESLEVPVIYLTAYADEETVERAKITEPYGYILKPFKELELRTAIEMALYRAETLGGKRREEADAVLEEIDAEPAGEIVDQLKRIHPFSLCDAAAISRIAKGCKLQKFDANEPIAFEGEQETKGVVVLGGRVALVKTSMSGKDLIVDLLPPGDPYCLFTVLDENAYSVSLRAQVESTVLWVPRSSVMLVLDQFPELARKLIADVFGRLRRAHDLSRSLAHDIVAVRVAAALSALIPRFQAGGQDQNTIEGSPFSINMTRQELAEMIGSTSETVIRETKAMERDGLLDLSKSGTICILDPEGLKRIAEESE